MADIDLKRVHNLGIKAARHAADKMVADLAKKFGLSGGWAGNTHHFERPGVTGSLHLTEKDLHLTVKLGLLLKMMRGPLEVAIIRELDTLFDKHASTKAKAETGKAGVKKAVSPKTGSVARKKSG